MNSMYVCVCVYIYKEIPYKELAYVIVEADKSQELQDESASWRPGEADALVPV